MNPLIDSLFSNDDFFKSTVGKNERDCPCNTLVRVYRNLNKPEFYSILARTGKNKGKVVGYAKSVRLTHAKTVVSEKSRQRVINEGRKNVHAFCEGIIVDASNVIQDVDGKITLTYSPYKMFCDGVAVDTSNVIKNIDGKTNITEPIFYGSFYKRLTEEPISMTNGDIILQGANVYSSDYFNDNQS